jgi:hypothetical protein
LVSTVSPMPVVTAMIAELVIGLASLAALIAARRTA